MYKENSTLQVFMSNKKMFNNKSLKDAMTTNSTIYKFSICSIF